VPLDEYRSLLLQADIALDSSPFNGGTTTCETLHLGLPLITLRGEAFISRMGYAILKSLNLEEWVASTPQHYVQIAVALSKNVTVHRI
jgi:predicted O-linked N-acetylglucosamine transferase (SPINDLY family)